MKTKEELIELKNLYSKRMETSKINIEKFAGKPSQQEWLIQFHMARGKVEVLQYLIGD